MEERDRSRERHPPISTAATPNADDPTAHLHLEAKPSSPPIDDPRTPKKVRTQADPADDAAMDLEPSPDPSINTDLAPQPPRSFKDMLMHNEQEDAKEQEEELNLDEDDVTYSLKDGIPAISFSSRVKELLDRSMGFAVIIKVLGKRMRYTTLRDKLPSLWKNIGPFRLIDCAGDCFIAKFSTEKDYQMALLDGPGVIYGHYLSVQPWTSEFSLLDHTVNQVIGWVRLPMLPIRYYNKQIVRAIGKLLGNKAPYLLESRYRA